MSVVESGEWLVSGLDMTRSQILDFRRRTGGLDERLPPGPGSLQRAAWAGLQDSMPRAALLSIHARVEGTGPTVLEDSSLIQLWGPRFSAYVVAGIDRAVFTLGRLPDDEQRRQSAEDLANEIDEFLAGRELPYGEVGRALGGHPNRLRYAAPTGRVLIRWDGARQPTICTVPAPDIDPHDARLDLARRYLHIFAPSTPESFARWAGVPVQAGVSAFQRLGGSVTAVRTPVGEAWVLTSDEPAFRATGEPMAGARLLPSGDAYYLLHGAERSLLVEDTRRHATLWTSRVWPGAVVIAGDIVGTWRRTQHNITVQPWRRLSHEDRTAVEAEAATLPLPIGNKQIIVSWDTDHMTDSS